MSRDLLKRIARLRVPLGFVLGAATAWLAHPTPRSLTIGGAIAVIGESLRLWAAGHLEKGREVTTSGPYRWTRHPLYVGTSVMGVGLVVAAASAVVGVVVLGYLGVALSAAIRTEEAHLTEKFGAAYPEYREGRSAGGRRQFSFARAFRNREHRAIAGLAIALAILAWKAG